MKTQQKILWNINEESLKMEIYRYGFYNKKAKRNRQTTQTIP